MSTSDSDTTDDTAPSSSKKLAEPKQVGKYVVEKRIGAGGMGTVYLAHDSTLKRKVALKILSSDKAGNETLVRRFRSEAQAAAQLRHDNIVAVYDSGEADGYLYIAMEYVDGQDLHEMIARRGRFPVARSVEIIKQAASALQHAYEKKIVHRDIKPSNLLIRRDGVVKITDLGLARSIDDTLETNITRSGTTVGTVDYMAPEQARHSKLADIRSDIYSLGCTWFHMLTGKAPFTEGSMTNKLQAHATKPLPNPHDFNDQVTEGLIGILQKMTEKKPDDRYQTPRELLDDLAQVRLSRSKIGEDIVADVESELSEKLEKLPPTTKRIKHKPPPGILPPKKEEPKGFGLSLSGDAVRNLIIVAAVGGVAYGLFNLSRQWSDALGIDGPGRKNNEVTKDPAPAPEEPEEKKDPPAKPEVVVKVENSPPAIPVLKPGDYDPEKVPAWIDESPQESKLPILTVGPGDTSKVRFNNLADALAAVPPDGAIIRLSHLEPVAVPQELKITATHVVIEPEIISRPALLLFSPTSTSTSSGFLIDQGKVVLRKLQIVAAGKSATPVTICRTDRGQIEFRDCAISAQGDVRLTLADLTASKETPEPAAGKPNRLPIPRLLLERTWARGKNVTALDSTATHCEAVFRNSLLISQETPLIQLAGAGSFRNERLPQRRVYFVSSTLSALKKLAEVKVNEGETNPGSLSFAAIDSLISSPGKQAVLLETGNWPEDASRTAAVGSRLTNLRWDNTRTLTTGFSVLMRHSAGDLNSIVDGAGWQRMWGNRAPLNQFVPDTWPAAASEGKSTVNDFNVETIAYREILTKEQHVPGCRITDLTPEDLRQQSMVQISEIRPATFPLPTLAVDSKKIRKVDLLKEDLQKVIMKETWLEGTTFEITGVAKRSLSPIRIVNRSCTLVFRQGDGQPFSVHSKDAAKGEENLQALFTIEGGRVEIVDAAISAPYSAKGKTPRWLIHAKDAHVVIRSSELLGHPERNVELEGLILFEQSTPQTVKDSSLVIEQSVLSSSGRAILSSGAGGVIGLGSSVLIAGTSGVELKPVENAAVLVDFRQSVAVARDQVFRVDPPAGEKPYRVSFFSDRMIFAPIGKGTSFNPKSAVVLAPLADIKKEAVQWWGREDAFSSDWPNLVVSSASGDAPVPFSFEKWSQVWSNHVYETMIQDKGVVWIQGWPDKTDDIRAANLVLSRSCPAAGRSPSLGPDPKGIQTVGPKKGTFGASGSTTSPRVVPKSPGF